MRKQDARYTLKLLKPDVYKKKLEDDANRARKKFALVTPKRRLDEDTNPAGNEPESEPDMTSTPQSIPQTSFSNKQSKCRSLSHAEKFLPKSPNKRKEIIGSLAQKYSLRKKKPGPKRVELREEEKNWLHELLSQANMSYINPGRKDNVYVGKKDGKSQYVQKRFLMWSLRDIHDIIKSIASW